MTKAMALIRPMAEAPGLAWVITGAAMREAHAAQALEEGRCRQSKGDDEIEVTRHATVG